MNAQVRTTKIDKNEIQYMVFGNSSTKDKAFVIIPGLSVHSVMGLAEAVSESYKSFANDYTIYLFDRPSFLEEGYTIEDIARDTASAMKAIGISHANIFGASQGGMIALYLALDYPHLCNKVVLGSTLSRPNSTFISVVNEWVKLAQDKNEEKLLESFVELLYSKETIKAYKNILIESNRGISDEEYKRFVILASSCLNFNIYEKLKNIKVPLLVLGSNGDKVVTGEASLEIAKKIGCEYYIYPENYGHAVYDEAPDYKTRMLEFFK